MVLKASGTSVVGGGVVSTPAAPAVSSQEPLTHEGVVPGCANDFPELLTSIVDAGFGHKVRLLLNLWQLQSFRCFCTGYSGAA